MKSIKRSHVIILLILILVFIFLIYLKYIRIIQIKKLHSLKMKINQIEGKIDTDIIEFYRKLNTTSKIYSIKKEMLKNKLEMANLLENIKDKTYVSSVIKNIIFNSGVKIDEFNFSGFDVKGLRYNNHYSVKVTGQIYNILKLLENIEYENEWLSLDSYSISFNENGLVDMSFNLTAYGRVK